MTLVDRDGGIKTAEPVEPYVKAARSRGANDNDVGLGRGHVADSVRRLRGLGAGREQRYLGILGKLDELGLGAAPVN